MSAGLQTTCKSALLDAALTYAARGWQVLPLHGIDAHSRCSCGRADCESPGKHPRTKNGLNDATTDTGQIMRWWNRWPEANIGIRTGYASGIFVLDIDSPEALEQLRSTSQNLPTDSCRQKTGRGWQYFFKVPDFPVKNSTGKIATDIDVRGEGGYVVVPPSRHISGRTYTWLLDTEPGLAPDWLLSELAATPRVEHPTHSRSASPTVNSHYTQAALRGEVERMAQAIPGTRNDTLNRAAFSLGRLEGQGLPRNEAEAQLVATAVDIGLTDTAARRTFASGWRAGTQQPRLVPDQHHQAMVERHEPVEAQPTPSPSFPRTDSGNAELFAHLYRDIVRYDHQRRQWLIWQGHRFASDVDGHILRLAYSHVQD